MITLDKLSLSFGTQPVIDDLSLSIQAHQRIALVGRNGSGKSTLLEIIAGTQSVDRGSVSIARSTKVAYLPQDVVITSNKSVLNEAFSTFEEVYACWQRSLELEHILESGTAEDLDAIVEEYSNLQMELIEHKHEELMARAKTILTGLQFSSEWLQKPVSTLSGGWKMRLVLAKLLLQKADFYLFDEPTNHLDILAQEWFLNFLKEGDFGFILVCHERYFLDELCNQTLVLNRGETKMYSGGYTAYQQQQELEQEAKESAYVQQQKEIKRKLATAERFRASASKAKMAQSMFKAVDRMEKITLDHQQKSINLKFSNITQPGKVVLTVQNLAFAFGDNPIFDHVSFAIERGERVALIGPNGRGKTTLFNVVAGKYPAKSGTIEFGHNVKSTVFEQDQNKALLATNSILDEVSSVTGAGDMPRARALLGAFLFTGDDVKKRIEVLSGGEKNRVAMVKVLLQNANVLLLDEPTNHLDIPSKEILAQALEQYPGTLFFVSHDRDFLNRLATRVIDLTPHGIHSYKGNFDDYLYQINLAKEQANAAERQNKHTQKKQGPTTPVGIDKNTLDVRKQASKLLEQVDRLERSIEEHRAKLGDFEYGTKQFDDLLAKLNKLEADHARAFAEWEAAEAHLKVKA